MKTTTTTLLLLLLVTLGCSTETKQPQATKRSLTETEIEPPVTMQTENVEATPFDSGPVIEPTAQTEVEANGMIEETPNPFEETNVTQQVQVQVEHSNSDLSSEPTSEPPQQTSTFAFCFYEFSRGKYVYAKQIQGATSPSDFSAPCRRAAQKCRHNQSTGESGCGSSIKSGYVSDGRWFVGIGCRVRNRDGWTFDVESFTHRNDPLWSEFTPLCEKARKRCRRFGKSLCDTTIRYTDTPPQE